MKKNEQKNFKIAKIFSSSSCINRLSTFVPQFAISFCRINCSSEKKSTVVPTIKSLNIQVSGLDPLLVLRMLFHVIFFEELASVLRLLKLISEIIFSHKLMTVAN